VPVYGTDYLLLSADYNGGRWLDQLAPMDRDSPAPRPGRGVVTICVVHRRGL